MGVHLVVIGLHPLHSSPLFVRVCFTLTHTFDFIGPCTSRFVTNPMLRLQHQPPNERGLVTMGNEWSTNT